MLYNSYNLGDDGHNFTLAGMAPLEQLPQLSKPNPDKWVAKHRFGNRRI
jgi:hypothetical protein